MKAKAMSGPCQIYVLQLNATISSKERMTSTVAVLENVTMVTDESGMLTDKQTLSDECQERESLSRAAKALPEEEEVDVASQLDRVTQILQLDPAVSKDHEMTGEARGNSSTLPTEPNDVEVNTLHEDDYITDKFDDLDEIFADSSSEGSGLEITTTELSTTSNSTSTSGTTTQISSTHVQGTPTPNVSFYEPMVLNTTEATLENTLRSLDNDKDKSKTNSTSDDFKRSPNKQESWKTLLAIVVGSSLGVIAFVGISIFFAVSTCKKYKNDAVAVPEWDYTKARAPIRLSTDDDCANVTEMTNMMPVAKSASNGATFN
jgi:hypothetical protein